VLVQAANEAVAKKTHANPVATRFNMPRFPRLCRAEVKKLYSLWSHDWTAIPAFKPLTNQETHPAFH